MGWIPISGMMWLPEFSVLSFFFHGSKRTLNFLDIRSDQQGAPALIRKTRLSGLGCQSLCYFSILVKGAGDQQLLPAAVAGRAHQGKKNAALILLSVNSRSTFKENEIK